MAGAEVSELIQGFVIAMNCETTEAELINSIFPHPTLSESAILTLGQVCTDFRDLSGPVIQLVTAYLQQEKVDYGEIDAPADIGEIIRIKALMSQNPSETTYE